MSTTVDLSSCANVLIRSKTRAHTRLHSPSIKCASKKSVINVYYCWHFDRSSFTWMWLINRGRHKNCKATHIWRWDQQRSRDGLGRALCRMEISLCTGKKICFNLNRGLTGKAGVPSPITQAAGSCKYALTNKQRSLRCLCTVCSIRNFLDPLFVLPTSELRSGRSFVIECLETAPILV